MRGRSRFREQAEAYRAANRLDRQALLTMRPKAIRLAHNLFKAQVVRKPTKRDHYAQPMGILLSVLEEMEKRSVAS